MPKPGFVDGLSFLPDDLEEIRRAGLVAMICDVSEVGEVRDPDGTPRYRRTFETNVKAIDAAAARLSGSDLAFVAERGSDIGRRTGCAAFLQFQSCEPVADDLARISYFYGKGLRVLQFTHHNDTAFAGGALERVQRGLTRLGVEGLDEMNRLRILPDVSHGSVATMLEAARLSRSPIVYSHGACRAILDHPRCIPDEAIRAIADRGGVIGIFMMSFWLTRDPQPRVEHLIAHIRHVIQVGGIEAVGISNDFPMAGQPNLLKLGNDNREGVKEYLEWWLAMRALGIPGFEWTPEHVVVPELNTLDRMVKIRRALEADGFRPRDVDRIMGGNFARVLTDVLG
ncbi:membrane dipeptidase [Sphingomonas parva]|uniref:membrane dipeptidase n=1 Tax=Sphingomonas parva TaxID=2555898 RepID=UPI001CDC2386|nr:membrane dipeptidase [Sphingomonas parva]